MRVGVGRCCSSDDEEAEVDESIEEEIREEVMDETLELADVVLPIFVNRESATSTTRTCC